MEFLDKLVLPQSGDSLQNLEFLLMLGNIIFLIYSGVLFGSSLLSVIFNYLGKAKKSEQYLVFAKDLIDLITSNKMFAFGLGIIPFTSVTLLYTQLLHATGTPIIAYLIISFVLFLISLILIYSYKHSLHLSKIFDYTGKSIQEKEESDDWEDFEDYSAAVRKLNARTAVWAVLFLFASIWMFIGSNVLAVENPPWEDVAFFNDLIFSFKTVIKFAHFVTASLAITGAAFVVKVFLWDKFTYHPGEEYANFAKKFNFSIALIFTVIQPVFLVLNLIITPKQALSGFMFGISLIILFLVFLAIHYLLSMLKENKIKFAAPVFYILLIMFSFIIVKEQIAFSETNEKQVLLLAQDYQEYEEKLLAEAGAVTEEINGEEIYNTKCMACHQFDTKKVGPPHKEVLPKYMGNKKELVKFILNPVKVNPAYPAMPSQNLKPKEAEAVAEYMIQHFGPKLEGQQQTEQQSEQQEKQEQPTQKQ